MTLHKRSPVLFSAGLGLGMVIGYFAASPAQPASVFETRAGRECAEIAAAHEGPDYWDGLTDEQQRERIARCLLQRGATR
jgi:hypothetical protein